MRSPVVGEATLCARVIVEELLTREVRDVVLSPGSRSGPLAYELFDADKIGLLRLHVRIDERSAAFVALGLAKASGTPVAVVTTSGTAVANLHPAVLEASHSHVPLVVITADRPGFMIGTGANQTTDQRSLFADHVRASAQIEDSLGPARAWRFHAARMLTAAAGTRSHNPGPVHLNVGFSEPLAPQTLKIASHPDLVIAPVAAPAEPTVLVAGPQTVVLAGDASPEVGEQARVFAAAAGVPLLAEPSSNARQGSEAIGTYRLVLASGLADEIERVVVFGHPTLSRPVTRLLQREDVELIVVSPYADWVDPGASASMVTAAVTTDRHVSDRSVSDRTGDEEWLERWRTADAELRTGVDALLADQTMLTGPAVAATLWAALGERDTLIVGSSNPVRDLDLTAVGERAPLVFANRGLAGIDGLVSTAVGVALAVERPCHALLGDVTFLHDSNGLILGPAEPRPDLRIVVANDDGGSIFATLEQGLPSHMGAFERVFGTPHGVDLAGLAQACGAGYRRAETVTELEQILLDPPLGIELVEAVIDRAHRRTLNRDLTALAAVL